MPAAESRVMQFEDETAIVVTRYDRVLDAGRIVRIHQDDVLAWCTDPHWTVTSRLAAGG